MQREGPLQIIIGKYDVGDKAHGPIYVKWLVISEVIDRIPPTYQLTLYTASFAMAPSKMKAAVTIGEKGRVAVKEIDVPKPGPGELLVKIVASAANPTDCNLDTLLRK